ncbi:putative sugar isomerase YihS [Marinomonas aquimarina]|uniref:Putative sugar isomerase YihS n=1 Tax=Marinomonas aquimarina TaxID=295068 RepID=A0A1A8TI94_9GAMM|nr:AGE family epimerase/isomerase [Marinomonas aquimarina]SBS32137.1 putative sugar isomerase YihS [Marinomonas aquimarina]
MPRNFLKASFLQQHTRDILNFYEPVVLDDQGGFFQNFLDDGRVFDHQSRHLVSSTRFIFNYAEAYRRGYGEHYADWARHGLKHLEKQHYLSHTEHYAWQLGESIDKTAMAYGQAFVVLAYAHAHLAGICDAKEKLLKHFHWLEKHFYQDTYQAYADERSGDLKTLDAYRGQNANMHLCEAFIAAYRATADERFLKRAKQLAKRFSGELCDLAGGLIWEHYDENWQPDWHYNIDKPDDLFKPWGFQPGHQVEWTKLLLQLHQLSPEPWYVERAKSLFDQAIAKGWDQEFGGLVYGFTPKTGAFADAQKYFWVQAEAIAAAYRLFKATEDDAYLNWYNKLWQYSWDHLIDHQHGAWYRLVARDGSKITDEKSPMGKVDYHTLGACWDVLDMMSL